MTPRILLSALIAGISVTPTLAQNAAEQLDRRNRDYPEVVVEAAGRYGTCDALLFDRDGQFLFAGGDDKVVRVWPYSSAAGLDTDRNHVRVLRWRAWREQRGGIKSVAVSPDGKRVAVGGYGLKPSTVAVLDRETGDQIALTWPKGRPGERFNAVTAVGFDGRGKRVAFGTADGSIWVWEPRKLDKPDGDGRPANLPRWAGRHDPMLDEQKKATSFNQVRLVYFPNKGTLVSVAQSGQVLSCDLGGELPEIPNDRSPAKPLLDINADREEQNRVFRALVSTDGQWLVLACNNRVILRSTDGKQDVRFVLPAEHFARSIALDPKTGRLAVGVGAALPAGKGPRFYADGNDSIWLYDNPTKGGEPTKKIAHRGTAEALAFHPKDGRLAVAGGDADEVTLLDLATPEKPITVVRGAGRRPWAVNLSENGNVLGVQTDRDATATNPNRRGAGSWTRFDIPRLIPTADETQKWLGPIAEADGWKIVPDKDSRFLWHAVKGDIDLKLATNPASDNAPTCFTFLPGGGDRATRVIVGHTYGCSLFELLPAKASNGVLRPAKVFTGHAGEVLSVVAAKDQSWFVTGGSDQTVAAWSLVDWQFEPSLGATFAVKNNRVVVTGVAIGSPAWEAGLMVDDVLDLVAVGGPRIPQYDHRPAADREKGEEWGNPGTPEEAVALLKNPRPRVEIFFSVAPTNNSPRRTSLTTVRQRPMWKWFPAFDDRNRMNDWVIWMWHGSYYHTQSTHGDDLVGWHVNNIDPGVRPRFYKLRQYEPIFHKRSVLELLVRNRKVADALADASGKNPQPLKFSAVETEAVRLEMPSSTVGNQGLPLTVSVRPRGTNADLLPERVELWVNDHRYKVWPERGEKPIGRQAFERALTIPSDQFRAGENQIAVLTFNAAGGRAEEFRLASNPRAAGESTLLGMTVGIDNYSANRQAMAMLPLKREGFKDLDNARRDAQELTDRLLKFPGPGKLFRNGRIELRLDKDANRKKLLDSLDTIAGEAKPDDLLIVFYAGHGDLLMPEAPKKPGVAGARGAFGGNGVFLFCCPDYSPARPKDTAVSADEMFDALARVKCRKVVLLDACHSGGALDANVIRRFIPHGQGPFVIAACDRRENSYEHPKFGHGLFTYAVLDALGKDFGRADRNRDGQLSARELYDYVATRMPVLEEEIGVQPYSQNPICFPRDPPTFAVVKQ